MEIIKSYTFSSANSINNSTSNPLFNLPYSNTGNGIEGFSVSSFTGVNTVYNIDSRNNRFTFSEQPSFVSQNLIIPNGNYTVNTFITTLESLLRASSPGTMLYTVTVNSLTNLITITSPSLFFRILPVDNNCYYECGFVPSGTNVAVRTAPFQFDFSGLKQLFLVSSSFGTSNTYLVGRNFNVIAAVPIATPFMGVISYTNSPIFISSQIRNIDSVSFMILDERGRVIDLNKDWSVSILLKYN